MRENHTQRTSWRRARCDGFTGDLCGPPVDEYACPFMDSVFTLLETAESY